MLLTSRFLYKSNSDNYIITTYFCINIYIYVLIKKYSYSGFMLGKFNNRSENME